MEEAYLVFNGSQFYPCGGMEDLVGVYPTLELAQEAAHTRSIDWYQIVHVTTDPLTFTVVHPSDWRQFMAETNTWSVAGG